MRASRARRAMRAVVVATAATLLAAALPGTASPAAGPAPDWLAALNELRAVAGAPAVVVDSGLAEGVAAHARYMLATGRVEHFEDPASPWFTAEGDAAARGGLLAAGGDRRDRVIVRDLVTAPFHGMVALDPSVRAVAFAVARRGGRFAAVLRPGVRERASWRSPLLFPGTGQALPAASAPREWPDPHRACGVAASTSGVALWARFLADDAPIVTGHAVTDEAGRRVGHCVLDVARFTGASAEAGTARALLGAFRAVVVVPLGRWRAGGSYRWSVTTTAGTATGWFRVAGGGSSATAPPVVPSSVRVVAPSAVTAGEAFTAAVVVRMSDGTTRPGSVVRLRWRGRAGVGVASATTDAAGVARVRLRLWGPAELRAEVVGTSARSEAARVRVRWSVRLRVTGGGGAGDALSVVVSVTPSVAVPVTVQWRVGGRWVAVISLRTQRTGDGAALVWMGVADGRLRASAAPRYGLDAGTSAAVRVDSRR